jgi:site-specific DNA-methyltransferase (adenine-specific)
MHPGYNAGSRGLDNDLSYYGDNLEILRKYIPDESVDLVYLDPPFNSNRDYNVILKSEAGRKSDAELLAFEDTCEQGNLSDSSTGKSA